MNPFNWDNLRVFLGVARAKSALEASHALGIDQSTISRRIKRLETDIGSKLFDRSSQGHRLTSAGHRLLEHVEKLESTLAAVETDVFGDNMALTGEIRLGATEAFGSYFLAPHLAHFCTRHPAIVVDLLPVPRNGNGVDLIALEQLAAQHRPKLYSTVSVLHNPTGHSIDLAQAHRVLQLAQQYDFMIVEDDTYASLAPAHSPRYAALDGVQRTFYITGFAKIIAPGWRVGCVAAPPQWVDALLDTKLIAGLNTPSPTERAVALCLQQGWLRRHAEPGPAPLRRRT